MDLGPQFKIDLTKAKTPNDFVFRGNKYRISILSDSLIRFEYSERYLLNEAMYDSAMSLKVKLHDLA